MLALEDLKKLPRAEWHKTPAKDAMRPITIEYFVDGNSLLSDAQNAMKQNGIGALGVVDDKGNLIGFLQHGKLRRAD